MGSELWMWKGERGQRTSRFDIIINIFHRRFITIINRSVQFFFFFLFYIIDYEIVLYWCDTKLYVVTGHREARVAST